ncbi:MAG: rhodanese-like protein [Anaerosolibacter sp.]|jgi:rhodanese-related sulfurtransferase|uniref:rhodanese-like domain-containing protein n=1 Tax=Anaerosolibacter sp. TaxID=1872527 RepID=UPI0026232C19|nr:rhodanese-like domain-containing protein [Anaerosolibacter sp.]MDF2548052.1 rhodanese-like protein [Anaerosolibacter sp.]
MLKVLIFKKRTLYVALGILLAVIIGIAIMVTMSGSDETFSETIKYAYKKISPEQAKILIEKNQDVVILDVRNEKEYDQGHLPQATLMTFRELKKSLSDFDREQIYMLYGEDDRDSAKVAQYLGNNGFARIYMLTGGIEQWPYEIE